MEGIMWNWLKPKSSACRRAGQRLPAILAVSEFDSVERFLDATDSSLRAHVTQCAVCRAVVEGSIAARSLLRANLPAAADPGPIFTARVMRAIAERERRESLSESPWFAVPAVAARLSLVSAVVLLFASTWVYEQRPSPPANPPAKDVSADFLEPAPPPATQDEVLVSLAEREP